MNKRLLPAVFIAGFFCLSLFSGCVSQPAEPEKDSNISAKEVLDKSFEISAATDTYSYKMTMRASLPESGTGSGAMDVMNVDGRIDKADKKMHLSTVVSTMQSRQRTESYVIGNTYYTSLPTGEWTIQETANDALWRRDSMQGMQEELLNSSVVSLLPEENFDGSDCYVINIIPQKESLPALLGKNAELPEQTLSSIVSAGIKEWVEKDSFLMKRLLFQIDVNDSGRIIKMETDITFSDYGIDQIIELPADAKNAKAVEAQT